MPHCTTEAYQLSAAPGALPKPCSAFVLLSRSSVRLKTTFARWSPSSFSKLCPGVTFCGREGFGPASSLHAARVLLGGWFAFNDRLKSNLSPPFGASSVSGY